MMLYPLLFIIWSHVYYTYRDKLPKANKLFELIILTLAALVTILIPAALFFDLQDYVNYLGWKILLVFSLCGFFTFLIYKFKTQKILAFIGFLVMVRLGFSLFVLPHRLNHMEENYFKKAAIEMGNISNDKPFFFYQYHPDESSIPFHDRLIFYIQRTRMKQVKFTEDKVKPGYYFTFDRVINDQNAILIKTYQNLKFYKVE